MDKTNVFVLSVFPCLSAAQTVEIQKTTTTHSSGLISLPTTAPLIKQKQTVDSHLS